ncbi:MAG: hypothetical protein ACR2KT_08930 [Methylocella sp.]
MADDVRWEVAGAFTAIGKGHLEKYPFRAASKSDSKNLFEFDQWERCDGAIGFL